MRPDTGGVNGFGYLCRNKSGSAAGAKPGNTEKHGDAGVRSWKKRLIKHDRVERVRNHVFCMIP